MNETVTEEFIYEYWDCPKCGNKAIRGDEYKCPSCGYPRDNTITFYRKSEEEKIDSEKQVESFTKGPDWICSFCDSLNHNDDANCKGCGATKEDSARNYFEEQKIREEKAKSKTPPPPPPPPKSKKSLFAIIAGLFLFIGFICWGVSSHKEIYKVEETKWVRAISVERYDWKTKSDWKGELTGDDPQVLSENREIRRYEKRQVGTRTESYQDTERYQNGTTRECSTNYTSTGSGASKKTTTCKDVPKYSTRNVTKTRTVPVYQDFPIYDTKVKYRSKSFATRGYVIREGKDNAPKWPEFPRGIGIDGKPDREGQRLESYQVKLERIDGKKGKTTATLSVSSETFESRYLLGSELEMYVNNFGNFDFKNKEKEFDKKDYENEFGNVFSNRIQP
jgi:ribosomal protein L37E